MKRICKQCGKEFFLSQSELNFYRSKKLAFPKRCKECRANNKGDDSNVDEKSNESSDIQNTSKPQKAANMQNASKPQKAANMQSTSKPQKAANKQNTGKPQGNSKNQSSNTHKPQNNRQQYGGKPQNDRSTPYVPTYGQNVPKETNKGVVIAAILLIVGLIVAGLLIFNAIDKQKDDDNIVGETVTDITVDEPVVTVDEPVVTVDEPVETTDEPVVIADELVVEVDASQNVAEDIAPVTRQYTFASKKLLDEHYQKHGIEMGFASAADYEKAASDVVNNPNALTKKEAEDNDDVYYVEATNEFVVVSTRGFIRTYFKPNNGKKYYDKQ